MGDTSITIDHLPIEAHTQWASNAAAYDPTLVQEAQKLAPLYEKSTGTRSIFRTAFGKLFDLAEGSPTLAHFEEPPITLRLPLHIFSQGNLLHLPLADNEELEWIKDRPTHASLQKCLGLPETLEPDCPEAKLLIYLEEWLFLQRLGAQIYANTHKRKV